MLWLIQYTNTKTRLHFLEWTIVPATLPKKVVVVKCLICFNFKRQTFSSSLKLILYRMYSRDTPHSLFGDLHVHHLFQFLIDQLVGEEGVAHRHVHRVTLYWWYCSAYLHHLSSSTMVEKSTDWLWVLHLHPFFDLFKTYLRSHKLVHSRWNKNRSKSLHPGQLLLFCSQSILLLLSPHLLLHLGRLGKHLVDVHDLVQVLVAGKNAFLIHWHTMGVILLSLIQVFNGGLGVKKKVPIQKWWDVQWSRGQSNHHARKRNTFKRTV